MRLSKVELHCFALALAAIVLVAPGSALAQKFKILDNYDLPGNDLRSPASDPSLREISAEACRQACRHDRKCTAFTYNRSAGWCFLKTGRPTPQYFTGAISGVSAERQKTVAAPLNQYPPKVQDPPKEHAVSTGSVSAAEAPEPKAPESHNTAISAMPAIRTPLQGKAQHPDLVTKGQTAQTVPLPMSKTPQTEQATSPKGNTAANAPTDETEKSAVEIPDPPKGKQDRLVPMVPDINIVPIHRNNSATATGPIFAQQTKGGLLNNASASSKNSSSMAKTHRWQMAGMIVGASAASTSSLRASPGPQTPPPAAPMAAAPEMVSAPTTAPAKIARLTEEPPKRPLIDINKDAQKLRSILDEHAKIQDQATALSNKYFRAYDREQEGTKWVDLESVGMSVPMTMSKSQAKAIVLSKLRKSETLERLQNEMAQLDDKIETHFGRIQALLSPQDAERLQNLHDRKKSSLNAFRAIRDKMSRLGDAMSRKAKATWQMPTDTELRKLHRLARSLRRNKKQALVDSTNFTNGVREALNTRIAVRAF